MTSKSLVPKSLPLGLALLTCATLLMEITFTRIFSVTMWYHFAFMAISVAMFGMAFGSVLVYLKPHWFEQEKLPELLGKLAIGFSISVVAGFWLHIHIPFVPAPTLFGISTVLGTFLIVTIPFMISGVAVSLVLTRFPKEIGRLYAYDLIGAATGCLLLWLLMRPLTGPGVVLAGAAIGALAAVVFTWDARWRKLRRGALVLMSLLVLAMLIQPHYRLLQIGWVKNAVGAPVAQRVDQRPLVERWNSHACITIFNTDQKMAIGWGLSPVYEHKNFPLQLYMLIDAAAGTPVTQFTGDLNKIRHLKYDVTSLAHHLRPESEVLIIGTGGGRDILTSLLFNPKRVTGVEINADILEVINEGEIGRFTGNLAENPKVRFVHDEARSWIERSDEKFDIIQASLIDSWAATSAGAFVLTENSLYTEEAWTEFLSHLTQRGVLTMSRWWVRDQPGEMIRVTSLAYAALRNLGLENPRQHVMIATTDFDQDSAHPNGVGTIVVSRKPFNQEDIQTFIHSCESKQFRLLLTPEHTEYEAFARVLDPKSHEAAIAAYPININPPTDDTPFFFNMLRFGDIFSFRLIDQWVTSFNMVAITILAALFALVTLMSIFGLLLPLWIHERGLRKRGESMLQGGTAFRHGLYFGAIGLGFILVEIGQIQRLTLFLGHPVYSLTIVLFSLLLATGIGSYISGRLLLKGEPRPGLFKAALGLLFAITLAAAIVLPDILTLFHGAALAPRIMFSLFFLFAMGIPMGTAFPVGLSLANAEIPRATPWLWAINGALSVVGSVLAMVLSIGSGITFTCLVGAACYLIAWLMLGRNLKAV